MKFSISVTILTITLAATNPTTPPPGHEWIPGGPDDFRGPCPMMNTLANHGFLPRNGKNLTRFNVVRALRNGLNFDEYVANLMWEKAVFVNPEPNATFFTLRSDAYFGNHHVFNQTIFDTIKPYWTDQVLTAEMLANSKVARQFASKVTNPEYRFSSRTEAFSLGEIAAPILVLGDIEAGTAKRDQTIYVIENERLPYELGFTKQARPINLDQVRRTFRRIAEHASLITPSDENTAPHKRHVFTDSHFGPLGL